MVAPVWIAATTVEVGAFSLIALAGFLSFMPGGALAVVILANVMIAAGVALGMVGGGVQSPLALAIVPLLIVVALLIVSVFQWFGPGVKL